MSRKLLLIYLFLGVALLGRVSLSQSQIEVRESEAPIQLEGEVTRRTTSEGRQIIQLQEVTVWVPVYPRANLGDLVRVEGEVYCPKDRFACEVRVVKADRLVIFQQVKPGEGGFSWILKMTELRQQMTDSFFRFLPKSSAELLSGIVFGGSDLSLSFKSELADVGLSHIVAASGMNVTFFAALAFSFLSVFRTKRRLVAILGSTLVWLYCGIAGFDAPVVRAGLMVSLTLFAQALGRNSSSWWGLGLSGYIMLWVNPGLIHDFGFLLSFASMIGQITVSTIDLRLRMAWNFLAQSFIQNAAAILATLPIVIWLFGRFSLVTIFTNLLVVWTIEPLMILGLLAVILGIIAQPLAQIALIPAGILLTYFIWVVEKFSVLPWAVVRLDNPGWLFLIGYYLLLTGGAFYVKEYRQPKMKG